MERRRKAEGQIKNYETKDAFLDHRAHDLIDSGRPLDAALVAFRKWRFKPNTVSKVKIPISFTKGI